MDTQVTPIAENQVQLEVEVPQDEVDRRFDQTLTRVAREASLPGFRKGRVPKQMILSRFGEDYVLSETLQDALPDWYEDALVGSEVQAVSTPELDMGPLERGTPFTFKATVQVRPTPGLGQYKGVEVARRVVEVTDEQVQAQLAMMQERFATLAPVEDRAVQEGDFVTMDFAGSTADGPLEGAAGSDYSLQVGSGRLVPGFEEALVGMAAAADKRFEVTFPDDYPEESLQGAPVSFTVTVKEIKEKVVPDLGDDFARDVSEFDSLDELTADVRSRIEKMQAEAVEREFRGAVIEAVTAAATLNVPEAMVEREAHSLYHELEEAVGEQNMTMETYLAAVEKTPEQVEEDLKPRAEANVRRRLVLEAVAEAEGLEVTDDEVRERIRADAEIIGRDGDQLVIDVYASGRQEAIRDELLITKTVEMLVEAAVATELVETPAGADENLAAASAADAEPQDAPADAVVAAAGDEPVADIVAGKGDAEEEAD